MENGQKYRNMSLINRMLLPIAPKLACEREEYVRFARGFYTAADQSGRSAGWTSANATGELVNQGARDIVRARARDLERNSDILGAEILAFERNVVGTGIVLQAKILGDDGKEDEPLNAQIEELWRVWCRPGNCEITGRFSLSEIEALIVRRRYVDGGILILKVYEKDCFKLQLIEVDDLDNTIQTSGGNRVIGGIETDAYNRPIAYHIKIYDAWGFSVKSKRVPADRVIYLPHITRPSQIREFSPSAPSLSRIDDVDELIGSAVEKERVLSHLSLAVENASGTLTGMAGIGRGLGLAADAGKDAGSGARSELLGQGTITYLRPGEKISTIAPAGSSSTVDPLIKTTQRLAGGSAGLSYEVASRDMSQVTYSSARQGFLEDQRTYKQHQKYLIDHFCDNIYQEWMEWVVLSNRLNVPQYFMEPEKYWRHVWIASGWDWIDPLKESSANLRALESNQTTLQEICASKGKDYRDVIKQRGIEIDLIQQYILSKAKLVEQEQPQDVADQENPAAAAAAVAAEGESIQKISLNGAQLDSLVGIVQLVVTGMFPYESAVALLTSAFPFEAEIARQILNNGKQIKMTDGGKENVKA